MSVLDKKLKSKSNQGFTIVETIIVLAIASLILLVVLEAIPALERSSRNNQRRQDVSTILGAVSQHELNNSGDFPSSPVTASSDFLYYINQNQKLTYYNGNNEGYYPAPTSCPYSPAGIATSNNISIFAGNATDCSVTYPPNGSLDSIYIINYQKCKTDNSGGSSNLAAGYGDIVALYAVESGNNNTVPQCRQL